MKKYLSEFFGTFILVFAGCGTMVTNELYGGALTHVGVALVWGMVVMVLIYSLGDVSGAHFNPAVTIGFLLAGLSKSYRTLSIYSMASARRNHSGRPPKTSFPAQYNAGSDASSGYGMAGFCDGSGP